MTDRRQPSLAQRLGAEGVGTGLLLATVVGSGIMGERLAGGDVAIALLANTLVTGAGLVALILTFGPVSGAHFNPAVTLAEASLGGLPWREVPAYVLAQVVGAFAGVAATDTMFDLPAFIEMRASQAGVASFEDIRVSTYANEESCFSYRRSVHRGEADYGRLVSAIAII